MAKLHGIGPFASIHDRFQQTDELPSLASLIKSAPFPEPAKSSEP